MYSELAYISIPYQVECSLASRKSSQKNEVKLIHPEFIIIGCRIMIFSIQSLSHYSIQMENRTSSYRRDFWNFFSFFSHMVKQQYTAASKSWEHPKTQAAAREMKMKEMKKCSYSKNDSWIRNYSENRINRIFMAQLFLCPSLPPYILFGTEKTGDFVAFYSSDRQHERTRHRDFEKKKKRKINSLFAEKWYKIVKIVHWKFIRNFF